MKKLIIFCVSFVALFCCVSCFGETIRNCEHNYVLIDQKNSSCEVAGNKVYMCTKCGTEYSEYLPPLGHNEKTVYKAPTCTEEGGDVTTCLIVLYVISNGLIM